MIFNPLNTEEIIRDYEKLRLSNKRELQKRREEIYRKIPRIEEIETSAKLSYLEVAKARLRGKDTDRALTEETSQVNRGLTEEKKSLLVAAGYPADYLEPIFTCTECMDTGYAKGKKCICYVTKITNALYLQSNIGNILEKENFNTFDVEYYSKDMTEGKPFSPYDNINKILESSHKFVDNFGDKNSSGLKNILIYGETGLGKTFLTNCIAKGVLDKGHSVLYLSSNELFEEILAEYLIKENKDLSELYRYIFDSELLIIDDLGTEITNNFVLSQLFEVINKREINGRSTLISTNLQLKQLQSRYTERIMSRLIANYTTFNIYGDNIRYQKRRKLINSST